jgi:hypothetical protein
VTDDQVRRTGAQLIHLLPGLYTEVEVRGNATHRWVAPSG